MKPVRFQYHAPSSVPEALALLHDLSGEETKVLAGGQSLMPFMNLRLVRPSHLVDINGLTELDYIRVTEEGGVAIGALTRQRTLERSAEVASRLPLLAEAIPLIGDRQVRCRGTAGGSIAHADAAAEIPTVALALDADIVVARQSGTRTVPASQFFLDFYTTALDADELVVELRFPPRAPGDGNAFLELSRQQGAFAIVSAAATVTIHQGRIRGARICLGAAGPTPLRARSAEQSLQGQEPTAPVIAAAGRAAAADADPISDVHGSDGYRRQMAEVYTRRALGTAVARATSAQ